MMRTCHSLAPVVKDYVDFDPNNPDHLKAFKMLCLGETYNAPLKQHETLRFKIQPPFPDVRTMMFHKVSEAHINMISN
jgi:hypothetical protein